MAIDDITENKFYELETEGEDNGEFENLEKQEIVTDKSDPSIQSLYFDNKNGDINLQPDFQRQFVWTKKQASALIESILLDIPIPTIYFSEDMDSKLIVIDGQQRLTSIFAFIDGKFPEGNNTFSTFKLNSLKVLNTLNGKTFKDLSKEEQRIINKYPIRTITFKKNSGKDIKFDIFERLNCGSVALNDMELRNCIYRGEYLDYIKELSQNSLFRKLVGLKDKEKRMKDVELVLRFFAFSHKNYLEYKAPIKKFLNEDCESYRSFTKDKLNEITIKFKNALDLINSIFAEHAFKRFFKDYNNKCRWEDQKFNVSLYDIYMWVFSRQDKNKVMRNLDLIREATMDLMINNEKFIDSITKATSGAAQVNFRFETYNKLIESILKNDKTQSRCFSYEFKKQLFEENPTCKICNNKIMTIDDAAVDHIEQFWLGGTTTEDNARLTHRYCNDARPRKENEVD